MKKLVQWLFGIRKQQLDIPVVIDSNFDTTKVVKVKITYPYYEDIIEEVSINVPIGLNEEDEYKLIDEVIERDYAYLYGR
jgi:hypothetical protein